MDLQIASRWTTKQVITLYNRFVHTQRMAGVNCDPLGTEEGNGLRQDNLNKQKANYKI